LKLVYRRTPNATGFTATNLAITLQLTADGTWSPEASTAIFRERSRTLDGALGAEHSKSLSERDSFTGRMVLVDYSGRFLIL